MSEQKETKGSDLIGLWRKGVALDYAWIEFARFFDYFAYQALQVHPDNDDDVLDTENPRYRQLIKGWLPHTWDGRQEKLEITRQNERVYLLENIYFGDLWAIGYATRPDGSDALARVPRQLFFVNYDDNGRALLPEINWEKGEISKGDTSYFDVHVVQAPQVSKALGVPGTDIPSVERKLKSHPGRPKTVDEVTTKVEQLWESSPEFRRLPNRQAQAEEVRAQLCGQEARGNHDLVGYKTSTLVKRIGQILKKYTAPE